MQQSEFCVGDIMDFSSISCCSKAIQGCWLSGNRHQINFLKNSTPGIAYLTERVISHINRENSSIISVGRMSWRKQERKKKESGIFNLSLSRPHWTDRHQIWCGWCRHGLNSWLSLVIVGLKVSHCGSILVFSFRCTWQPYNSGGILTAIILC